ncbi:hypothetical protein KFU94_45020 [Chloroflexi bacterium TSY]|nr:hypothetical protein [Chloroflexi bacterium TSY]
MVQQLILVGTEHGFALACMIGDDGNCAKWLAATEWPVQQAYSKVVK